MKKTMLHLMLLACTIYCNAQSLIIPPPKGGEGKNGRFTLKEDENYYSLQIKHEHKQVLDIYYEIGLDSADAGDISIHKYKPKNWIRLDADNEYTLPLQILIKKDNREETTEVIKISFFYAIGGELQPPQTIAIVVPGDTAAKPIENKKKTKASATANTEDEKASEEGGTESEDDEEAPPTDIMYLNAYNFDFANTTAQSHYVGHLNIFSTDIEGSDWGVNAGIMKVNYSQDDSTINDVHVIENVLINPYEPLLNNSKYLRQVNSYKTQRKNTVWSIYIQPLRRIAGTKGKSGIFVHGHLELLPSKWTSKTTITNIKTDTTVFTEPAPRGFSARTILSNTNQYTVNGVYGYFGVGMTFDLNLWKDGSLFFQPTIGTTTNFPQPSSMDINSEVFPTINKREDSQWTEFYLIRAYFKQTVNKTSQIIIGTDIRGLFPVYRPLYAVYAGLNLSLSNLLDLLTKK